MQNGIEKCAMVQKIWPNQNGGLLLSESKICGYKCCTKSQVLRVTKYYIFDALARIGQHFRNFVISGNKNKENLQNHYSPKQLRRNCTMCTIPLVGIVFVTISHFQATLLAPWDVFLLSEMILNTGRISTNSTKTLNLNSGILQTLYLITLSRLKKISTE